MERTLAASVRYEGGAATVPRAPEGVDDLACRHRAAGRVAAHDDLPRMVTSARPESSLVLPRPIRNPSPPRRRRRGRRTVAEPAHSLVEAVHQGRLPDLPHGLDKHRRNVVPVVAERLLQFVQVVLVDEHV